MVNDAETVFDKVESQSTGAKRIEEFVKAALLKDIRRRMTPQPLKIRADVEITCFDYDGVEHIRSALKKAEEVSNSTCDVKVSLVASPLYVFPTQTADKEAGIELISQAISAASVRQNVHTTAFQLKFRVGIYSECEWNYERQRKSTSCERKR